MAPIGPRKGKSLSKESQHCLSGLTPGATAVPHTPTAQIHHLKFWLAHMKTPLDLTVAVALVIGVHAQSSTQNHYVRGQLQRVTTSAASFGGAEDEGRGIATPRISGDGEHVVFYADAVLGANLPAGRKPPHHPNSRLPLHHLTTLFPSLACLR